VEAPRYAHLLPELPRLVHAALQPPAGPTLAERQLAALVEQQRRTHRLVQVVLLVGLGFVLGMMLAWAILAS
jgi:ubiquinone biosynthesis protein